jgi:hypothetical protein
MAVQKNANIVLHGQIVIQKEHVKNAASEDCAHVLRDQPAFRGVPHFVKIGNTGQKALIVLVPRADMKMKFRVRAYQAVRFLCVLLPLVRLPIFLI